MAQGRQTDKANWKALQIPYEMVMNKEGRTRCYQISERSAAMFLSQAEYFFWSTRWSYDGDLTDEMKALISEAANAAVWELMDFGKCAGCTDYLPTSGILSYLPNDPFEDPPGDYTPGYPFPPFYVVTEGSIPDILGAEVGDIITDFTRISANPFDYPDIISRGFPRIRVEFEGEGEVEIHLLKVPLGGLALMTLDEDPATAEFVFLNTLSTFALGAAIEGLSELFEFAVDDPIFVSEEITEFQVTGDGTHTIDITFLPQIGGDTLLGFGGGFRKVVLCGLTPVTEENGVDVRQNSENPCILEKSIDGETWEEFADLLLCPPRIRDVGGVIETSADGETWTPVETEDPPIPPRDGENDVIKCLAAANAVEFIRSMHIAAKERAEEEAALVIAVSLGAFVSALIFFPVTPLIIAGIFSGAVITIINAVSFGALDETVGEALQCILYCRASADEEGVVTFAYTGVLDDVALNDDGAIWTLISKYIEALGGDGLNRAGAVALITDANCEECACDPHWCYEWTGSLLAEWDNSIYGHYDSGKLQPDYAAGFQINRPSHSFSPGVTITALEVEWYSELPPGSGLRTCTINGSLSSYFGGGDGSGYNITRTEFDPPVEINSISFEFDTLATSPSTPECWISRFRFEGEGTENPLGEDNCVAGEQTYPFPPE